MANSIDFNGVDLGDYNLIVTSPGASLYSRLVSHIQLQDRGYAFRPQKEPRRISIKFAVTGTSRSNLDSNLDTIRRVLTELTVKQLIFDALSDRYYNAILESFRGDYAGPDLFTGRMYFICPDPVAYSTTETSSDHDIDADPKTVSEVVGGSAFLLPVYTLEAGETLTDITLLVNNLSTLEELSWEGSLADTEVLVIDCARWLVTKEGTADMATVTGKFPRLEPNITNSIKVTGFGSLGTLNITYKEAYL